MSAATMKAVAYHRYGGPEVLELVERARPAPGPGQVLVRVRATSINSADYRMMSADPFLIRFFSGLTRPRRPVLGIDLAGEVVELGPGVTELAIGDAVLGDCFPDGMGAFAEHVVVTATSLVAKPEHIGFDEAAAIPLAAITALQALRDKGEVRAGQRVLVQGAGGGVGTAAVQIAVAMGAHVTAVCGPGSRDVVASLGADTIIDYTREDFAARGETWDVILGVNGSRTLRDFVRSLAPGGTYVMIGGGTRQLFEAMLTGGLHVLGSDKRVHPLTIDDARRAGDLAQLAEWLTDGRLRAVVDRTYTLDEIADAMRYVAGGHVAGKVVLTVP